jgi:hypothetical protein
MVNTSITPATQQSQREFKASPGKVSKTLSQKQNENKRAGGLAQIVEYLPWVQSPIPPTSMHVNHTE